MMAALSPLGIPITPKVIANFFAAFPIVTPEPDPGSGPLPRLFNSLKAHLHVWTWTS